jgi:hypothetical protein
MTTGFKNHDEPAAPASVASADAESQSAHAGDDAGVEVETIEERQLRYATALSGLRDQAVAGDVAAVDEGARGLYAALRDPELPRDFVAQIGAELKGMSLLVNMKATDMALRCAIVHAQADRKLERNQEIARARGCLGRAMALGAKEDFKRAADMMIESVLLTGGVRQTGPTRAKPVEDTPPPRGLAKVERREFKRFTTPALIVMVADKSFATIDWSMGGMLVGGVTADEFPSGEPVQVEITLPMISRPVSVWTLAARVEIRKGGIGVRFFPVTPELSGFLRRQILTRGAV